MLSNSVRFYSRRSGALLARHRPSFNGGLKRKQKKRVVTMFPSLKRAVVPSQHLPNVTSLPPIISRELQSLLQSFSHPVSNKNAGGIIAVQCNSPGANRYLTNVCAQLVSSDRRFYSLSYADLFSYMNNSSNNNFNSNKNISIIEKDQEEDDGEHEDEDEGDMNDEDDIVESMTNNSGNGKITPEGIQVKVFTTANPASFTSNHHMSSSSSKSVDKVPNISDIFQTLSSSFGGDSDEDMDSMRRARILRRMCDLIFRELHSERNANHGRPCVLMIEDLDGIGGGEQDVGLFVDALRGALKQYSAKGYKSPVTVILPVTPSLTASTAKDVNTFRFSNSADMVVVDVPVPSADIIAEGMMERRKSHNTAMFSSITGLGQLSGNIHDLPVLETQAFTKGDTAKIMRIAHGLHSNSSNGDIISKNDVAEAITIHHESQKLAASSVSHSTRLNTLLQQRHLKLDNYEKRLVSSVCLPSSSKARATTFSDIILPDKTKNVINDLIAMPLLYPEFFQTGILKNSISGVLLFGPPGTGKTLLARAIADESQATFINITPSTVFNMYVGEAEKNVRAIFSLARKLSPSVLFVDEVDSLFATRDYASNSKREVVNEFMMEWDGIKGGNEGVLVVGATNRPFDLDEAVLRRLPRRVLIDLPNQEQRFNILRHLLRDDNVEEPILRRLSEMTENFSGSDLKNVSIFAVLEAKKQRQSPTIAHFETALFEIGASVGDGSTAGLDILERLRKWNRSYGARSKESVKVNKLGFQ